MCEYLQEDFDWYFAVPHGCWATFSTQPDRITIFNYAEITKSMEVLWYFPKLIYHLIKAAILIKKNGIQVVHVGDIYNMLGVGLKWLYPELNLIYHIRLRRSSYIKHLYNIWRWFIIKSANHIICVSKTVEYEFGATGKVHVIYDAIDESWLKRTEISCQLRSVFRFLYVGNFVPGKGQDLALKAFNKSHKQIGDCELRFVGGTLNRKKNQDYLRFLKKQVRVLKLQEKIRFSNFTEDIKQELNNCDVLLNFSESEAFSMVCLEALSQFKPVIATRSGGPEEIIKDEINGFLVDNRNVEAMSKAMIEIAGNSELVKKFSSNARLEFKHKFNLPRLAAKVRYLYRNGIGAS